MPTNQAPPWVRAREGGVVGFVPRRTPEPFQFIASNRLAVTVNSERAGACTRSSPWRSCVVRTVTESSVTAASAGLTSGQLSRLISITQDWSRQAETVSAAGNWHTVESGAVILNSAPRSAFDLAYTSFVAAGSHRLAPRGRTRNHAWWETWRQRVLGALRCGTTSPAAIIAALRLQLAERRANRVWTSASQPKRLISELVRLAHFIAPNAPPVRLSQVSV